MTMNYAPDKGQDEVKLRNVVRVRSLPPTIFRISKKILGIDDGVRVVSRKVYNQVTDHRLPIMVQLQSAQNTRYIVEVLDNRGKI